MSTKTALKRGLVQPSMLAIEVQTKYKDVDQVRIVPRKGFYVVEVIYGREVKQADVNPAYYAGIDIGMNNLVALTSNKPGFTPVLVNGRPVKSIPVNIALFQNIFQFAHTVKYYALSLHFLAGPLQAANKSKRVSG